jgi:hypothetical protein
MKPLLSLLVALFFCSRSQGMEDLPTQKKDEILHFNIGAYKMDLTRSTIELSGGSFLQALISGKFAITTDKGRIFIDRPKEEGKLIAYFVRTQALPAKFDKVIAKEAAEFFGLEDMRKLVERVSQYKQRSQWGSVKKLASIWGVATCNECKKEYYSFYLAVKHLIERHQAQIVCSYDRPQIKYQFEEEWCLMYQLPMRKHKRRQK